VKTLCLKSEDVVLKEGLKRREGRGVRGIRE